MVKQFFSNYYLFIDNLYIWYYDSNNHTSHCNVGIVRWSLHTLFVLGRVHSRVVSGYSFITFLSNENSENLELAFLGLLF